MIYNKYLVVIWKDDPKEIPQMYSYRTWKEALEDAKRMRNKWKLLYHILDSEIE